MTAPWRPRGEVVQVVDGDTVHTRLDIGWGILLLPRWLPPEPGKPRRINPGPGTVRVLFPDGGKYDAPESTTAAGKRATAFVRNLVPVGAVLLVESFHLDDFGRTLGAVTLPDGRDWATVMASAGYLK